MDEGGSLCSALGCSDSTRDGKLHSELRVSCASCGCKQSFECVY